MSPSRRLVEHAETLLVHHVVVAHVQVAGVEDRRVEIEYLLPAVGPLQLAKMLLGQVDELVVLNGPRADDDHVLAKVHPLMVVDNHLPVDLVDVVDLAEDRQAHHVVPVDVEVHVFHEGLEVVVVCRVQLLEDRVLLHLDVVVVILRVAKHVAEDVDRVRHVILEGEHMVQGELATRVCIQLVAFILNLRLQFESVSLRRALEM